MKLNRILQIMKTEYRCIKRNETNSCDRKCEKCDLVLPTNDLLDAYEEIIVALEYLINRKNNG